jgi:ectoine hydroxylase-related dioxygenase (phytanoyl-CoA dioxygenase family)
MNNTVPVQYAEDPQKVAEVFSQEGCVLIPNVLTPEEVAQLREKTDAFAADETIAAKHRTSAGNAFVLRFCHELDAVFANVLEKKSVLQITEAVLGKNARFNAMNVIRNGPGQAISNWHVDDTVEFPLPDEIARFDPRMKMPVFWMTVQVALSDIDAFEHGPTQYVPGSHYSGRNPPTQDNPQFEGHGGIPVLCKAGDIYLTNHQCWHRGAPNVSDRVRYVMQLQYATRWADARFKGLA